MRRGRHTDLLREEKGNKVKYKNEDREFLLTKQDIKER